LQVDHHDGLPYGIRSSSNFNGPRGRRRRLARPARDCALPASSPPAAALPDLIPHQNAAEHLVACARLARDIPDFGAFETHDAYVARLKEEHGRKFGFWSLTAA
jgi:hypothetical protein